MRKHPKVVIVAAYGAGNRVIGAGNKLPWHIPSDLKTFKNITKKGIMIMGHNTWKSFKNKALPGRRHIVVTSDPDLVKISKKDEAIVIPVYNTLVAFSTAAEMAMNEERETIFIIGGAQIYESMMPYATKMILTEVENPVDKDGKYQFGGDTFFPAFDEDEWVSEVDPDMKPLAGEPSYTVRTYARRSNIENMSETTSQPT